MKDQENPFEQLQQEQELKFVGLSGEVKRNVNSRRGIWSFIGDVIDLYIPKVLSTFINANTDNAKANQDPLVE